VIESVPEVRSIKMETIAKLEAAAPSALLATNTSGLPISGLAKALRDPGRFLGLHFFSPAERMPLVEVVSGRDTTTDASRIALQWLREIGRRPVSVQDGPGFFTTRVFAAYLDEAVALVREGVKVDEIEAAATANGRTLGPLAVLDQTGIALNLEQSRQAREDGLEARFCRPLAEPAFSKLIAAGRAGRRHGGGFFEWPKDGARSVWPGLAAIFPQAPVQPAREAIQLRLLAAEAREALRCLEEGVIASADDGDMASVLGLEFPSTVGGVLRWAEDHGLLALVAELEQLAQAHGERFAPSHWLQELASHNDGLRAYRSKEGHA
jgi:3-hydroxyacyl-CoA dehydrogenase/enoyl-CoA hydratase/3-hydroxybutyryl-CoA epimerase